METHFVLCPNPIPNVKIGIGTQWLKTTKKTPASPRFIALMMEAESTSETSVNFY
jgi:hypothetical protein